MNAHLIKVAALPFTPFYKTNKAVDTLAVPVPTLNDPYQPSAVVDPGVITTDTGGEFFGNAKLAFFGSGANGNTFVAKLVGWQEVKIGPQAGQWIPVTLADLTCTLGNTTGAGADSNIPTTSHRMVTTLAVNSSRIAPVNHTWITDNGIQILDISIAGFQRIQLLIGTGTSATDGNALVSMY